MNSSFFSLGHNRVEFYKGDEHYESIMASSYVMYGIVGLLSSSTPFCCVLCTNGRSLDSTTNHENICADYQKLLLPGTVDER